MLSRARAAKLENATKYISYTVFDSEQRECRDLYDAHWVTTDYLCGDSIESQANRQVIEATYPELHSEALEKCYGPYGYSLDYYALPLTGKLFAQTLEVIQDLSEYPLLSDDMHRDLCWESYDAEWESYGYRDFMKSLEALIGDSDIEFLESLDSGTAQRLYEALIPSGEYFVCDGGPSVCIQIDTAIPKCKDCMPMYKWRKDPQVLIEFATAFFSNRGTDPRLILCEGLEFVHARYLEVYTAEFTDNLIDKIYAAYDELED